MHEQPEGAERVDAGSGGAIRRPAVAPLIAVSLNETHAIQDFTCAKSARVERFLKDDAASYVAMGYANVFVLPHPENPARVLGYYTLSPGELQRRELVARFERKVPKGIPVPMAHIGFMGKCDGADGGIGALLLIDAARRIKQGDVMSAWGFTLRPEGFPENEKLVAWYLDKGFFHAKSEESAGVMYAPLTAFLRPED